MAKKVRPTGRIIHLEAYERPASVSPDKYDSHLAKHLLRRTSAENAIDRQRAFYAEILRPFAIQDDRGKTWANLGDGWKRYKFKVSNDHAGIVLDAATGMDLLYLLDRRTAGEELNGNMSDILQCMFKLGFLRQFIELREACEHMAEEGFVIHEARRRKRRRVLSDDEQSKAVLYYSKHKAAGLTNSDAAQSTWKDLKRETGTKASFQTVKSAVGIS